MDSFDLRSSVLHIFHNVDIVKRKLQQNNGNASEKNESQNNAYEFVAFLLWYIFLVLCCVVPTCCAYRRRRVLEQRLLLHQSNMRQSNSLFILSNLQQSPHLRHRNSEYVQQERLTILREELKGTTMVRFFLTMYQHPISVVPFTVFPSTNPIT
jgi:hypothetical protein